MMTDGTTGAVIWDASYRPFGEVALTAAAGALNNQRFPGQYADAETGYYDNWHRSYDPRLGRYLQSDPVGLVAGLNTYAYVRNNPVMLTDPTGQILPALIYGMMVMQGAVATIEFGMAAYFAYETVSGIMDRYAAGCRRDELVSFSDVVNLVPVMRYVRALNNLRRARPTARSSGGAPAVGTATRGKPAVPTKATGPGGGGGGGTGGDRSSGGGGTALHEIADDIRRGGHPIAAERRTIAVGQDSKGNLYVGSSNGLDKGQLATAQSAGVKPVTSRSGLHAEEELLLDIDDLVAVGTSKRSPCGLSERNCAGQLLERAIKVTNPP